jgi:hypothetical protein
MKIKTIRKEKTFIPDLWDNLKEDEKEQISVFVKSFPTITEAQSYRSFRVSDSGTEVVYPNDAVMLTRHIGKIANLEHDNAEEDQVTDGKGLAVSRVLEFDSLISKIRAYLLEASEPLTAGEN